MPTLQHPLLAAVAHSGLAALRLSGFVVDDRGIWHFHAERPSEEWHVHGAYVATPLDLDDGRVATLRVAKPRWKHRETHATVHSEPPSDLGGRYSGLIIALQLFVWLDSGVGLHSFDALFPDLALRPSLRTVQRWLARLAQWPAFETDARRAVLAHFEPRSPDILTGGIPPPAARRPRPWRDPAVVWRLHRGLAMVLGAAVAVNVPAALLVTEAWWKVEHGARRDG